MADGKRQRRADVVVVENGDDEDDQPPVEATQLVAALERGRVPGLTYALALQLAANQNGCMGSPTQCFNMQAERARSAAMLLVWAHKTRACALLSLLPRIVLVELLAKRVYHTRFDMAWAVEHGRRVTLEWEMQASAGRSPYRVVIVAQVPVRSGADLLVRTCTCPSADDLRGSSRYCKHVRDCLVGVEDRDKALPPRYKPAWQPLTSFSGRRRYNHYDRYERYERYGDDDDDDDDDDNDDGYGDGR